MPNGPLSRLRLRHLQCFLAVARLRQLRAAAEALSITQPAVTKTLNELEEIVGVRLLLRERRGVSLTSAGQAFLRHAGDSVAALGQALDSVRREPDRVLLRIGVLPTVAPALLAPALADWRAAQPGATLQVVEGNNSQLLAQLARHELDLAIARLSEPQAMPGITFEYLYAEPLTVVVRPGHPLVERGPVGASELLAYGLIVPPAGTLIRHGAEAILAGQDGVRAALLLETLSVSLSRHVVWSTDAVWLTAPSAVAADVARGQLVRLPLHTGGTDEPVGLLLRNDVNPSHALRALLDRLRGVASRRRQEMADLAP